MIRLRLAGLLCLAIAGALWTGCPQGEEPAVPPIQIAEASEQVVAVVSIEPQGWLVRRIGGERVHLATMVPPGQSPHSYEPSPGQLAQVARAQIYFAVGTGVEFEEAHLGTLREQAPAMQVVELGAGIPLRPWGETGSDDHAGHDHDHDHDRASGNDHGAVEDPHVWLSPAHLGTMAEAVRDGLVGVDPDHADGYRSRTGEVLAQLEQLDLEMKTLLEPLSGRSFLVVHPSWGYFADAYGLTQLAVETEGRQPGPVGVAAVIAQARELGIRTVFVSPQFDASAAEVIAGEIGGTVVTADPLASDPPAQLLALSRALAEGASR